MTVKTNEAFDTDELPEVSLSTEPSSRTSVNLWPVYWSSIFDLLGMSMYAPILIFFILTFDDDTTWVTIIVAVFAISSLFGSFVIGKFSDVVGRREALLLCVFGTVSSVWLQGCSVNLWMFLIARAYAGLGSISMPIVFTYIVSLAKPEQVPDEMALFSTLFSALNAFSPLVGTGVLAIVQQFGLSEQQEYRVVYLMGGCVSLFGLIYSYFKVPPLKAARTTNVDRSPNSSDKFPWVPCLLLFHISSCIFYPGLGVYIIVPIWWEDQFSLGAVAFGIYLTASGICNAIASMYVKNLIKKFGVYPSFMMTTFFCATCHALSGLFYKRNVFICHVTLLLLGSMIGVGNVSTMMLAGQYAPPKHRNTVMSIATAGLWMGYIIAAISYINLYKINEWIPWFCAAGYCFTSFISAGYLWVNHDYYLIEQDEADTTLSMATMSIHHSCHPVVIQSKKGAISRSDTTKSFKELVGISMSNSSAV